MALRAQKARGGSLRNRTRKGLDNGRPRKAFKTTVGGSMRVRSGTIERR
jgi:hypothetical protein